MTGVDGYPISALGTKCWLLGYGVDPSERAEQIFRTLIEEMDLAASRFREDSELCQVFNGTARREAVVSELLFDALEAALRGARVTNGYLDPTVEGSLVALGYGADFTGSLMGRSLAPGTTRVVLPPGYKNVLLNRARRSVSVPEGVTFDLGSTGKAFLADRIRERIESELSEPVLVNLGGDISASQVGDYRFWPIKVTDDHGLDPSGSGVKISIAGGGVATSSTLRRSWRVDSNKVHHIVDPFSGTSANSPFESVTVLAGSALDANIASSGTIAMGVDGPEWLASTGLPAFARSAELGIRYFGEWQRFSCAWSSI